ncbi:DUF1854 domain-containing protein [bacterium]|nr:MAG: DUF1854 domain-containing protein [bacterium]
MKIELFFQPPTRLCAQIDDERCVVGVKPVWAAPLSRPGQYLSILDPKGEDIVMIENPQQQLSAASWQAIQAEIRRRDLTSRVSRLISAREDNGAVYFSVATDRGDRDFVCNNMSTNAIWFGENRLLLLDTEGNRFEIEDLVALDARSQSLIEGIL